MEISTSVGLLSTLWNERLDNNGIIFSKDIRIKISETTHDVCFSMKDRMISRLPQKYSSILLELLFSHFISCSSFS